MQLLSLKNFIDFRLRSFFSWELPGRLSPYQMAQDEKLSREVGEFLTAFSWEKGSGSTPIKVLDIGAKNFFLAPFLVSHFKSLGFSPDVVGIEIDAYRRYADLKTREQYAKFYAKQAGGARFIPSDFLLFQESFDVALLLNPFVTKRPLLAWGLSLTHFRPQALFAHLEKKLSPFGKVILCCPTLEELDEALHLAYRYNFFVTEKRTWNSSRQSLQKQPRHGALLARSR